MNTLLLHPTDVLFFRDGRPMTGSLAGQTAAWPLPDVTNHALHAALHRAELSGVYAHRRGRSGQYSTERDRKFGSLLTAGPFPVDASGRWFFPRPKDAQLKACIKVTLTPVRSLTKGGNDDHWLHSSLPEPLDYAVGNNAPPDKEGGGEPWINTEAFDSYLRGNANSADQHCFLKDEAIADKEANVGIAIDPDTQTTGQGAAEGKIYSAHYLRLREGFSLGVLAKAEDKDFKHPKHGCDLVATLLDGHSGRILVGGQQRVCSAQLKPNERLHMPQGLILTEAFTQLHNRKFAVKWILLSPAVWPEIPAGKSKRGTQTRFHPGGWLPNWICPEKGTVLLRSVNEEERRWRRGLNAAGKGYSTDRGSAAEIRARLVAAIVGKPQIVTGWALPSPSDPGRETGGAKSIHLAAPAGSVYYFEADTAADAAALAKALNWHADCANPSTINNRRSTLLGEKGYGLGVCGTWKFFHDVA